MPYGIDPDAQNLLLRLLCNDPRRRLGYKDDAREIMHHQYFSGVNFEDYRNFRVKAPCQFIGLFDQNLGNLQNVQDTPIK